MRGKYVPAHPGLIGNYPPRRVVGQLWRVFSRGRICVQERRSILSVLQHFRKADETHCHLLISENIQGLEVKSLAKDLRNQVEGPEGRGLPGLGSFSWHIAIFNSLLQNRLPLGSGEMLAAVIWSKWPLMQYH